MSESLNQDRVALSGKTECISASSHYEVRSQPILVHNVI